VSKSSSTFCSIADHEEIVDLASLKSLYQNFFATLSASLGSELYSSNKLLASLAANFTCAFKAIASSLSTSALDHASCCACLTALALSS
jgi:hypothetical protein